MKLLHTSDLHATEGPRFLDQANVFSAIVQSAIERDVAASIITGDLAGTAVPHVATVAERELLADMFQKLSMLGPVVVVRGNHDDVDDIRLYGRLRGHYPIVVATQPEHYSFDTKLGSLEVFAVPWVTTASLGDAIVAAGGVVGVEMVRTEAIKLFAEFIESWVASSPRRSGVPRILAGHIAIGGARTAGGEVLLGHDVELPATLFDRVDVDYVGLGHIHLAQKVGQVGHYAGSPSPHAFDEEDPKGWNIVTFDGARVTVFRMPSPAAPIYTLDATWDARERWCIAEPGFVIAPGAEIRVRAVVPEGLMETADITLLEGMVTDLYAPSRVVVRRRVAVSERIRSAAMADATTIEEQAAAALDALVPPVAAEQRARVLGCVREVAAACGYTS